jgi:hypothetical protein
MRQTRSGAARPLKCFQKTGQLARTRESRNLRPMALRYMISGPVAFSVSSTMYGIRCTRSAARFTDGCFIATAACLFARVRSARSLARQSRRLGNPLVRSFGCSSFSYSSCPHLPPPAIAAVSPGPPSPRGQRRHEPLKSRDVLLCSLTPQYIVSSVNSLAEIRGGREISIEGGWPRRSLLGIG